ncbi:MAG: hypothetical protein A4E46_01932 [Methanosaeta sp. PtaU1.Bin016]|nr:MAG: hypothetical protein A4E46_01932 [Methanosaeta sp. PtaU1.Bin016]
MLTVAGLLGYGQRAYLADLLQICADRPRKSAKGGYPVLSIAVGRVACIAILGYLAQGQVGISCYGEELWRKRHAVTSDSGRGHQGSQGSPETSSVNKFAPGQPLKISLGSKWLSFDRDQVGGCAAHVNEQAISNLLGKQRRRGGPVCSGELHWVVPDKTARPPEVYRAVESLLCRSR